MCLRGFPNIVQLESIYKNSEEIKLVTKYSGEYNLEDFINIIKL